MEEKGAAVPDQGAPADLELVPPRGAAEVVVVVEHEDTRRRGGGLAEIPGGGQPADAGADDHEIVAFARVGGRSPRRPERPIPQRVSDLEGAVGAAPHTGKRRWIRRRLPEHRARREERPADTERGAVPEIAARQGGQGG